MIKPILILLLCAVALGDDTPGMGTFADMASMPMQFGAEMIKRGMGMAKQITVPSLVRSRAQQNNMGPPPLGPPPGQSPQGR